MNRVSLLVLLVSFSFLMEACSSSSKPQKRSPIDPCIKPATDTSTTKKTDIKTNAKSSTNTSSKSSKYDLVATKITWDDDIAPLVEKSCISCHDQGTKTPPELHRMPTSKRVLTEVVESVSGRRPTMPMGGSLSERNQDLFLSWEDDGFLEELQKTSNSTNSSRSNNDDPYDNASNRTSTKKSTNSTQDSASDNTKNPC